MNRTLRKVDEEVTIFWENWERELRKERQRIEEKVRSSSVDWEALKRSFEEDERWEKEQWKGYSEETLRVWLSSMTPLVSTAT